MGKKLYEIKDFKNKKVRHVEDGLLEYYQFDHEKGAWVDIYDDIQSDLISSEFDRDVWEEFTDERYFNFEINELIESYGINRIKSAIDQKLKELESEK